MKKKFCLIILFILSTMTTPLLCKQKTLLCKQKTLDLIQEKNVGWVHYIKKFGGEKFLVQFPNDPTVSISKQNMIEISTQEDEMTYVLRVIKKEGTDTNINHLSEILGQLGLIRIEDIDYPFSSSSTVDFFCFSSPKTNKDLFKGRIFVSEKNIYCFYTISKQELAKQHDKFITSFLLIA